MSATTEGVRHARLGQEIADQSGSRFELQRYPMLAALIGFSLSLTSGDADLTGIRGCSFFRFNFVDVILLGDTRNVVGELRHAE
jgi:hypothetical protein